MKKVIFSLLFFIALHVSAQSLDDQNRLRLAQAFAAANEFERAGMLYEQLSAVDSVNYVYFDGLRRCYIQLKNYDAAIRLSERRVRMFPSDVATQTSLAGIFHIAGKDTRADSLWDAILASAPKNLNIYRAVAATQSEQRLFEKTIATYLRGRKESGDRFAFANELAYLYSVLMEYTSATREYLLMLQQNEHQLEFIQSRLSLVTEKKEGLAAATRAVEEASAKSQATVLLRLLQWLYSEGKKYEAAFDVTKQIELRVQSNGTEIFSFAERMFREKEFALAMRAYQFVLQANNTMPFIPNAKFGYARCVEELSAVDSSSLPVVSIRSTPSEVQLNPRGAISLYASLAKEFPYTEISGQALYRIGLIYYNQMYDIDAAQHYFDTVLVISSAAALVPTVLSSLGDIYIAQGKLDNATQKFSAILFSQSATPLQKNQAQFRLAEVQYFKHNFDSTLQLLQPLIVDLKKDETNDALLLQYFIAENKEGNSDALEKYASAELYVRQKKYSEATTLLNDILEHSSDAPLCDDALLKKAELAIRMHRYNDALLSYQKLLSDFPKSILRDKAQFRIAEVHHFYLNTKAEAVRAYEDILSTYPFSLFADEARKRIRILRGDAL